MGRSRQGSGRPGACRTVRVRRRWLDAHRRRSVGWPLRGHAARVAEDGELLVRGPVVFSGYWNNPAATAESFDGEWFRTGDPGAIDHDGFVSITGRKKEIIVTAAGKNVSPAPLEDPLRAHPLVSQCMVVGDARPFIGALVTLDREALPGWLERQGLSADLPVEQLAVHSVLPNELNYAVAEYNSLRPTRSLPPRELGVRRAPAISCAR
ncbi:AMP-binding protein [Streptomyces gardneri]|nr:AMP-binding protein [Streptomyces gardneri]MBF6475331.1 AMP-binding protein [Nocardia abscessus]